MKLRKKITIVILGIGIIPLLLISFVSYFYARNQIAQSTLTKLDTIAEIQKNRLQDIINDKLDILNLFGSKPMLRQYLRDFNVKPNAQLQTDMDNNLLGVKTSVARIKDIFVTNPAGIIVASTNPKNIGKDISAENFFKHGILQSDISTIKKDEATGLVFQYLAVPLILEGKTLGMAMLTTDMSNIISMATDFTPVLGTRGKH